MEKNITFVSIWWRLGLLILWLIPLWAPDSNAQSTQQPINMEKTMNVAIEKNEDLPAMPPIDAAAPDVVATASFGLG